MTLPIEKEVADLVASAKKAKEFMNQARSENIAGGIRDGYDWYSHIIERLAMIELEDE